MTLDISIETKREKKVRSQMSIFDCLTMKISLVSTEKGEAGTGVGVVSLFSTHR